MQLSFSRSHIGWIARYATDNQLFFKIKTAWLSSNKQSVTLPNITAKEVTTTYGLISAQSEGLAAKINTEIEDALLPQLLNAQGEPKDAECAEVMIWIGELKNSNTQARQSIIEAGISELDK